LNGWELFKRDLNKGLLWEKLKIKKYFEDHDIEGGVIFIKYT
jgi:hypothetical protein